MTTTTTPEQADILPAEAIDLDALGELAKRLRREATAFDNDLGSDPEADAGTARLLREAAGAIDLARRAAVPSEQEPVAWRCGECGCLTFARIEERGYDGHFHPGPTVRCVSCKIVSYWPEPTHPAPAAGVKVKPLEWRTPDKGHPMEDMESTMLLADGIGGKYHISHEEMIDKNT